MDKRWELELDHVIKSSQYSPISEHSGNKVVVEVQLHNLTPSHQMDLQVDKEIHQVSREDKRDQDSEEDETKVLKCLHSENPKHAFLQRPVCPSSIALHQNSFFRSDASSGRQN